ncbi:coiled-coil domain-containing protein [Legionella drancourtii]|uniref:Uncharacterized protein n=1 Tax=Legionella drancourtii LLAP12 TaxID=658187 RepID=G9ELA6_9GAMM|nr:stage III sporulation protein SpoAB [Legionella drancourtii]EHL31995.1 hypothetical protein LDG_6167 [Legionella drancourtii LLAP12]
MRIKELCNEISRISTEITETAQQISALSRTKIELERTLQTLKDEQSALIDKQKELAELDYTYNECERILAAKQQQLAEIRMEFMLETEKVNAIIYALNETIAQLTQADMLKNDRVDESLDMMPKTFDEQLTRQEQQVKRLAELVERRENLSAEQAAHKELRFFAEASAAAKNTAAADSTYRRESQ